MFKFEKEMKINQFKDFKKIVPPKDRLWADPFIVFKNEKYFVFFEELIYDEQKAHISYFILDKNGDYSSPKKILDEKFHISYPFIFEYKNQFYMIPETREKGSICLYKCLEFPEKWVFEKELITNIDAVDSTIFQYEKKWWIFTGTKQNNETNWNNLHIFYSDNPINGNWISHPQNTKSVQTYNSRPAGSIYSENEKYFRPSQISTIDEYGKGIAINEIKKLNEKEFQEKIINEILPWEGNIKGIHTINHENNLTIIDAKWKIKR